MPSLARALRLAMQSISYNKPLLADALALARRNTVPPRQIYTIQDAIEDTQSVWHSLNALARRLERTSDPPSP